MVMRHDLFRAVQTEPPRKSRMALAVAMACLSLSPLSFKSAIAATWTWDGGGGNSDWSNGANWVGDTTPGSSQDLVFTGNVQTSANNDFLLLTNSVAFDAGADPFTLTGQFLINFGGITNASAATQSINIDLRLRGDQTISNTNGGSLIFGGTSFVFFGPQPITVTFAGNGTTTIASQMGEINGIGSVVKNDSGTLILNNSANNISGTVTVNAGLMQAGAAGAFVANRSYTVHGGILDLNNFDLTMASLSGTGGTVLLGSAVLTVNQAVTTSFAGAIVGPGNLVKQGAGTLNLTGANLFEDVTILGGGLVFDSGLSLLGAITAAGGDLRIENGATVIGTTGFIGRTGIGAAATATVTGPGSIWQTTGNISISEIISMPLNGVGGTLRVENGGQVNAGGELFLDIGGVLEIDSSSQVTAAGGLRSVFGTIRLLDSGMMNIPDITANNTTFDTNGFNGIYAGTITAGAFAPIVKTGAGVLTLTGNTVDTDPELSVVAGTVLVNGTFAGNVSADTGAVLGGAGTVGNVTLNGGTLAPGNSIGTLNVVGNVDFSAGGIYQVEVDDAGNSDLINATGTATLTNGTVSVMPEAGDYSLNTDYTILTASGGLGGTTFGSAGSTVAFLTPTLWYDANNVYLNLRRNSSNYAAVAGTPNQIAVGTALDTLAASGTASLDGIFNNLNILTADGANQAYDSLSGVQHTHANLVALQSVNQFKGILFDRISGSNQFQANNGQIMLAYNDSGTMTDAGASLMDGDPSPQRGWWMRGTGNFGDIDDSRNASGADYKAGGIAAGLDFDFTDNLTAGAAVGYTRTDADVANGGLDVNSYQAALYGRLMLNDGYYVSGLTGLGYHDMDASRSINVGLLNTSAEADYHAWTTSLAVEGGRSFSLNQNTTLTPFAGLEYAHVNRESFTEKDGGVTNLRVNEDTQDSLRSSMGARITHSWTQGKYRIQPTAELAWVHEFMEDEAGMRAGFAVAPITTFAVDGPDLDRDRARVALGLNVQLTEVAYLNLGYQGEFASSDDRHDFAATFRMMW